MMARKIVLATGRGGLGGVKYPGFVGNLPKTSYAHTCEAIDFHALQGKDVCVLGAGASACDAAAVALEGGARSVNMLSRREQMPRINKFATTVYPGFSSGFVDLPDEAKVKFMEHASEAGAPPPFESLVRLKGHRNFQMLTGVNIKAVNFQENMVWIESEDKIQHYDFLILATGFDIDVSKQPALAKVLPEILLWKEQMRDISEKLGKFPYLGKHFQFLEKQKGRAPYLQNIYCYNYASTLSHGQVSGDIPDIGTGAVRLAKGIAADFFIQDWKGYYHKFEHSAAPEFLDKDYPFIK
jgi:cation diffusion facilitator CzcD-associated flavoprotein CzcO